VNYSPLKASSILSTMATDEKAWEVSKSAFAAEFNENFDEALKLHGEAFGLLESLTHDGKLLQTEPVRLAKRQAKVHEQRMKTLRSAKASGSAITPLPTVSSFTREITSYIERAKKDIGSVSYQDTHA
jgi:hypothetical protein